MKIILFIALSFISSDSLQVKVDSVKCNIKLEKIIVQQNDINTKLDSLWKILEIDTSLRKIK